MFRRYFSYKDDDNSDESDSSIKCTRKNKRNSKIRKGVKSKPEVDSSNSDTEFEDEDAPEHRIVLEKYNVLSDQKSTEAKLLLIEKRLGPGFKQHYAKLQVKLFNFLQSNRVMIYFASNLCLQIKMYST